MFKKIAYIDPNLDMKCPNLALLDNIENKATNLSLNALAFL